MSSEKILYFIRHGQSEANLGREKGKDVQNEKYRDAQLTSKGSRQAHDLSMVSPLLNVEAVVCSPMRRAIQTASIAFNGQTVPFYLQSRIRELYLYDMENKGLPRSSIPTTISRLTTDFNCRIPNFDQESLNAIIHGKDPYWLPEEEYSLDHRELEMRSRQGISRALDALIHMPYSRMAVVCHWGVISNLLHHDAENCGVYKTILSCCNGKLTLSRAEHIDLSAMVGPQITTKPRLKQLSIRNFLSNIIQSRGRIDPQNDKDTFNIDKKSPEEIVNELKYHQSHVDGKIRLFGFLGHRP
jgi:broad specificity phosphatase PhoE